jgi:hypothetical protein
MNRADIFSKPVRAGGVALALIVDNLAHEHLEIRVHSRENSVNKEKTMTWGRFGYVDNWSILSYLCKPFGSFFRSYHVTSAFFLASCSYF